MKKIIHITACLLFLMTFFNIVSGEEKSDHKNNHKNGSAFIQEVTQTEDRVLLEEYIEKYKNLSKETILALIDADDFTSFKRSAAIHIFRENFSREVVSKEKKTIEKILLRRLKKSDSAFVQVEIIHTLCLIDRYKYFNWAIPELIQKLDHYNITVNELAYKSLTHLIDDKNNRAREARIVFNRLRKVLFLSRKRFATINTPDKKLAQKLSLVRWSVKVLGTQELKRLPKEMLHLI